MSQTYTAASMYFPARMSWTAAVWTVCARAKLASLIPKLAHLCKKAEHEVWFIPILYVLTPMPQERIGV